MESGIEMEINPIMDMYQMLEYYLPAGFMEKEEIDKKTVLRANWKKLVVQALVRTDELSKTQIGFKKGLIRDINRFKVDVVEFRQDFVKNGPLIQGIPPMEAVDRLSRFREELKIRERKFKLYESGESLFALPHNEYPDLEKNSKELALASRLFDLYIDVINTINDWKLMPWEDVSTNMEEMTDKMENFAGRCKKLPGRLREYESYTTLKKEIEVKNYTTCCQHIHFRKVISKMKKLGVNVL